MTDPGAPTSTGGDADRAPHARSVDGLRRYTWWSFLFFAAMCVLLPVAWSLPTSVTTPRGLVLVVVAVAVTVQHVRLLRDAVAAPGADGVEPVPTAVALVVALALPFGAPEARAGWVLPAAGVVAAAVVAGGGRPRRTVTAVVGVVLVAACGALAVAAGPPAAGAVSLAAVAGAAVTVFLAGSYLAQLWIWEVALRLDAARRTEADLAVARERLRFAADLHDVQGHHLQVIALKGELVSRLVGADDETARREAGEVAAIARTALARTRDVVQGYRRAGLGTEVGNAVQVLRAAGIPAEVDGDPDVVPAALQAVFGALVREGTTNVLRHSRATRCAVAVGRDGDGVWLTVHNDAPTTAAADGTGSGLAGLRERFAQVGGTVRVEGSADAFELRGRVSRP